MTDLNNTLLREAFEINKVISLEERLNEFEIDGHLLKEDHLIVHVDISMDQVFLINIDSQPRLPVKVGYDTLCSVIANGQLEVLSRRTSKIEKRALSDLNGKARIKALERFRLLEPLLIDLGETLRQSYGDELFKKTIEKSGRSKQYVYDVFNAYLFYGQRPAALALSIGKNIFHKAKKERDVRTKLGRPNHHAPRGKVLDEYDLDAFKFGERLYEKRNGPSLGSVYRQMMQKYYLLHRVRKSHSLSNETDSVYRFKLKHRTERPTVFQFRYWLIKQYAGSLPKRDRSRYNPVEYRKDLAGRTGDAYNNIISFGQVFELDETPFDEELVSVFDPTRRTKIGKATLYFVIDCFSKYIVGLYITTESPSFQTVRQTLFMAASDKTEFLKRHGFNPGAIDWSFHGIPTSLFVDNAEFRNKISEGAVCDLQTVVKFARRGRGDDKPNVEQLFNVFSHWFRNLSKGHQTKSMADVATQLARKNACLTINELYAIAIVYINYHNNHRIIKNYKFDRAVIQDSVQPIPAKLCEWSSLYRPGYTISYPKEELYLKLLSKGTVTVHQKGIYFATSGLWYNCEWLLEQGFQDKKTSRNRVITLNCRYNENYIDLIYIDTDQGLKPATLDHSSEAFSGLSIREVVVQKELMKKHTDLASDVELEYQLGLQGFMQEILKETKKEKQPSPLPNIAKIKDNRKLESLVQRVADVNQYLQLTSIASDSLSLDSCEEEESNSMNNAFYEDD